jgi:hypothetical protein
MLVLSGIKASWNFIHAGASGAFLTGTTRGGRNEVEIIADVSMDQLLAKHFAGETQVPALELSMDAPANAGACTGSLSCVYTHTLSWRSATQPLPMEWNPRAVFETLFGDSGSTSPAARQAHCSSTRAFWFGERKLAGLKRQLGPGSGQVDEYSESVRDVEQHLRAEQQTGLELPMMELAPAVFEDHLADDGPAGAGVQSSHARHHVHAEQGTERVPTADWRPRGASPAVDHNDAPELVEKMSKINRYHVELFSNYWRSCAPRLTATARCWTT